MGKISVIIYLTLGLLLLFIISQSPKNPDHQPHRGRHRRLKLRSNFTFTPPNSSSTSINEHRIPFDPLVADIERKREDKEWETMYIQTHHSELKNQTTHQLAPGEEAQPEWGEFADAEDYINEERRFNITGRLILLFPKIDVDPIDGFVTEHELTQWSLEQVEKELLHRSQRELEIYDKNNDGLLSFAEYEPPNWVKHSANDSSGYDVGWWRQDHFNASDVDGDGLLNLTEFNDFLHPADTKNPKLLSWLCKEEVRERDTDRNGKINFNEFFHGLFDMVRNYDEENRNSSHDSVDSQEAPAKKLFHQLDKDGDGFISDVELLPVIGKIHPSERYYSKQQSEYIIQQADSDKDGRLTLAEMIESPYIFYSSIFNEDEDEDYDGYHDEFR